MKYSILFGGPGAISTHDPEIFKSLVLSCTGIKALQKSDEQRAVTYHDDDPTLPEDIRGNWNKIATYLITA